MKLIVNINIFKVEEIENLQESIKMINFDKKDMFFLNRKTKLANLGFAFLKAKLFDARICQLEGSKTKGFESFAAEIEDF